MGVDFKLTDWQQEVVEVEPKGTLIVTGRVGSGKTRAIAERIKRLSDSGNVLFLAYNTTIVQHMRELVGGAY